MKHLEGQVGECSGPLDIAPVLGRLIDDDDLKGTNRLGAKLFERVPQIRVTVERGNDDAHFVVPTGEIERVVADRAAIVGGWLRADSIAVDSGCRSEELDRR